MRKHTLDDQPGDWPERPVVFGVQDIAPDKSEQEWLQRSRARNYRSATHHVRAAPVLAPVDAADVPAMANVPAVAMLAMVGVFVYALVSEICAPTKISHALEVSEQPTLSEE